MIEDPWIQILRVGIFFPMQNPGERVGFPCGLPVPVGEFLFVVSLHWGCNSFKFLTLCGGVSVLSTHFMQAQYLIFYPLMAVKLQAPCSASPAICPSHSPQGSAAVSIYCSNTQFTLWFWHLRIKLLANSILWLKGCVVLLSKSNALWTLVFRLFSMP